MQINPDTLEIEIISIEPIDGGVQVLARAWSDGVQIGFGKDGTVDIERFRIFNPPVLVDDPSGDVIITSYYEDPDTLEMVTGELRLREDIQDALLQSLSHTIQIVSKFGDENIIVGKRGNTTTTIYSSAGDGYLGHFSSATWAGDRDATTAEQIDYTTAETEGITIHSFNDNIRRAYFPFDTSVIGSGQTVTSATLSVYMYAYAGAVGYENGINVFRSPQSSLTTLSTSEYNIANWDLTPASIAQNYKTSAGWFDFSLNTHGISLVDVAGNTMLGLLGKNDYDNIEITSGNIYQRFRYSEYTGTTSDPKLVVEHSAGGGANTSNFFLMM